MAAELTDEQKEAALEAAHDAFNSAVPAHQRGYAEWCDRFDAARKAYDAALATQQATQGAEPEEDEEDGR